MYGVVSSPADVSEVEVRLAPAGDQRTTLVLEHTAIVPEERWDEYGPGAVGVGWDGGLLGLTLHLQGGSVGDPMAWQVSDEGRELLQAEQRGVGRSEPGRRRRPRCRRAGSGEHQRVLRADRIRRTSEAWARGDLRRPPTVAS